MRQHAPTVSIVDDDPSVRRGLARLLQSVGYDVTTFGSAREFLARGVGARPACVVLDVRMPGLSGLDLYDVLTEAGDDLPVIFISGQADIPIAVRALKSGAADFLTKPVDDEVLCAAVQRAIARDPQRSSIA